MRRALVLGGDRDKPLGEYDSSLQLIETGLFAKHGVTHAFIAGLSRNASTHRGEHP